MTNKEMVNKMQEASDSINKILTELQSDVGKSIHIDVTNLIVFLPDNKQKSKGMEIQMWTDSGIELKLTYR